MKPAKDLGNREGSNRIFARVIDIPVIYKKYVQDSRVLNGSFWSRDRFVRTRPDPNLDGVTSIFVAPDRCLSWLLV